MYLGLDSSTDAEPQLLNQVGRVDFASGVFFQVFFLIKEHFKERFYLDGQKR